MKSVMEWWLDESSWLACRIKKFAKTILPDNVQFWLKRKYYPMILGRDSAESRKGEAFLRTLVGPGDVAVDIGACIGSMALKLARIVGPTGKVIAFEPMPQTFQLLQANVANTGVTVYNFGLSDSEGEATMEVPKFPSYGESFYDSRITENPKAGLRTHKVKLRTLDSFDLTPQFIKIDVEGHEIRALLGAVGTIDKYHPALMIECSVTGPSEIVAFLAQHQYVARVRTEDGAFAPHTGQKAQDLFFFHQTKLQVNELHRLSRD